MKKRLSYILAPQHLLTVFLSLFLLSAVSSCSEDENSGAGKATVKMTFTTRASAQADGSSTLEERERMKTLRVIMENANTGKILYNVFYDNLGSVTSKTITFQDVPVEEGGTPFNFYAIANEASFLTQGESLEGKKVDLDGLYHRDIAIDFNSQENEQLSIPQAKKNQKTIRPVPEMQEHTVQLEFPVAKVDVGFTNEIETEQTVADIRMPGLKVIDGKLFPQDFAGNGAEVSDEQVPKAGTAGDLVFTPKTLSVPAGTFGGEPGKASVTSLYVYPAKSSSYKLTARWSDAAKEQTVDLNQSGRLADGIRRGMQLNIGITLKYGVMQLDDLTVTVDNWTNADVITPEFQ